MGHHGARAYGGTRSDFRHHDRAGANPAIGADGNDFKYALLSSLNAPVLTAPMLPAATQDLHAGRNLGPVSDIGLPQYAEHSDINTAAHGSLRMSKEGPYSNVAIERTGTQRHRIIRHPQVTARQAGTEGQDVSEEFKDALEAPESRQKRAGKDDNQRNALSDPFQPHECYRPSFLRRSPSR